MKKSFVKALIFPVIVSLLSSCGLAGHRIDDFFTEKELEKYGLKNLPKVTYQTSRLSIWKNYIMGRFYGSKDEFSGYAQKVLDFFKDNNYTYGGVVSSTSKSKWEEGPLYSSVYTYDEVDLYLRNDNQYLFTYKHNNKDYIITVSRVEETVERVDYNLNVNIAPFKYIENYFAKDEYEETYINKESFIDLGGTVEVKEVDLQGTLYVYLEAVLPIPDAVFEIDAHVKYYQEDKMIHLKANNFQNGERARVVYSFELKNYYNENSISLNDFEVNGLSVYLKKK